MQEFYIPSLGKGQLRCGVWHPEGTPIGVVQIIHGIAEHVERYHELAQALNARGFLVVGEDHMGHGKSIVAGDKPGLLAGGWLAAVDDTYALSQKVMAEYSGLPYFYLGHSMGSFMLRTLLFRYPDCGARGAMITGTGWQPKTVLKLGLALCRLETRRYGADNCSQRMKKLMFGAYTKSFDDVQSEYDWICTDREVVRQYMEDPLCGFDPPVCLVEAMLQGLLMIERRKNLRQMPKDLPVLFLSGARDPVGAMGKGVRKTMKMFQRAGMKNVTLKLYPDGRHEMHNETNKAEVLEEMCRWFCKNI